jgi:hypothetical protein
MKIEVVSEHSKLLDHVVNEGSGDLAISIGSNNPLKKSELNTLSTLPDPLLMHYIFTCLNYYPDLIALRETCRRMNVLIEYTEPGRRARSALNKEPSRLTTLVAEHELAFNYSAGVLSSLIIGVFLGTFSSLSLINITDPEVHMLTCGDSFSKSIPTAVSGLLPTFVFIYCFTRTFTVNPSFISLLLAMSIAGSLSGAANTNITLCKTRNLYPNNPISDIFSSLIGGISLCYPFNILAGCASQKATHSLNRFTLFTQQKVNDARAEIKAIHDSIKLSLNATP